MLKFNYEYRGDCMEKNIKKEKVNVRKYVNYVLTMVAIVLVAVILVKMYNTYRDNKLGESVFARMAASIQYDDIENTMSEMSTDSFILISYVKNEKVNAFEENLKKSIVDHELQNNFYYLDATNMMLEKNYINDLNAKFSLKDHNEIEELPAIIYYKNGKLMKTISSTEEELLSADDFDKLIGLFKPPFLRVVMTSI